MSNTSRIPVLDLSPELNSVREEIEDAIRRVLDSGHFVLGPEVQAFEEEVAAYLAVRHAVGVNSRTDALVLGLRAMGIEPGDEVVTTPFSFFATAESVSMVGARPVFADIDPVSLNIDPGQIEKCITEKTRAVMPVHLFGRPAEMERIRDVAARHELKIIEDCAQAFGAFCQVEESEAASDNENAAKPYGEKKVGTAGEAGAFSFFPSKNLGALGDGGLIATDDDNIAAYARMLRSHGSKQKYQNEILGYNSRLDALQAAVLRVKLHRIDQWNDSRRAAAHRYNELLADVPHVTAPELVPGHVFHQYTIRIAGGRRDAVRSQLADTGISTMIYYPVPQDRLPVYDGSYERLPHSDAASREVLSLPMWPLITPVVQARVADRIRSALET